MKKNDVQEFACFLEGLSQKVDGYLKTHLMWLTIQAEKGLKNKKIIQEVPELKIYFRSWRFQKENQVNINEENLRILIDYINEVLATEPNVKMNFFKDELNSALSEAKKCIENKNFPTTSIRLQNYLFASLSKRRVSVV